MVVNKQGPQQGPPVAILSFLALIVALGIGVMVLLVASLPLTVQLHPSSWPPTPTPHPTLTPIPLTPTPTPTPHPTAAPGNMEFRVGVSITTTVALSDLSTHRYAIQERRLQMPHCAGAVADAHGSEYFWILLQPDTARLRTLVLDGVDQLGAWNGGAEVTLDGRDYYAYRTISKILCGDTVRPGLGGAYVTITIGRS